MGLRQVAAAAAVSVLSDDDHCPRESDIDLSLICMDQLALKGGTTNNVERERHWQAPAMICCHQISERKICNSDLQQQVEGIKYLPQWGFVSLERCSANAHAKSPTL